MLTHMLSKAVAADPARAAIVQGGRRVRYDELQALAARCAGGLRGLGVGAGDCVAAALPNCPEFVAVLFGCAQLHAVMLPLDPRSTPVEWSSLVADAHARVVIVAPRAGAPAVATGAPVVDVAALLEHPAGPIPADLFRGPALYLYTSGSTTDRKRLCCSQENLFYEALNFVETVGLTAADNILCTIPLHHSYGLGNCLLDAVYAGSTLVLPEADDVPFAARCGRVLRLIREEAIRFYPGVPYQFQALAALPEGEGGELAGLRLCVSSGDVLPRRTCERFLQRFGVPIRSLYGSTEAGSIAVNTDPPDTIQFGSLGPPLKNVAIRIGDEESREVSDGESGHIWVKSPVLPPTGYDNQPELTARVFRDGYYNTGDLGMKDERGHLVLTGRRQTFIDVGGHKVDVGEVEEVLQGHPRVREAAALGAEAAGLGTLLKAVVVTDAGCTEAELLAFCRERLASFKVPRVLEFRDALPRSLLGKVLKSELGDITAYLDSIARAGHERGRQVELLAARIQEQVALSLQRAPASIPRSASFASMGFDSLRAAELHQRLIKLTGLPLSITVLWNYPTIDELAVALGTRMLGRGGGEGVGPSPGVATPGLPGVPNDLDDLLSALEGLSESEVEPLPLLIGSVKSNVGHLEFAAGICGLIKAILCVRHGNIPASLHFKEPNPHPEWQNLPVRVVTELTPWPPGRRVAGVSSYGFGGTNAFMLVEEPPAPASQPAAEANHADRPSHVLALSAKSAEALREVAARYAQSLDVSGSAPLADVCYTANAGRAHFEHRLVTPVSSSSDLQQRLRDVAAGQTPAGVHLGHVTGTRPRIAMLFTGQGSQYPGMGRELFDTQPIFRRTLQRCSEILRGTLEYPLLDVLYPPEGASETHSQLIHQTAYTQPALFALEYALAELWQSWGIRPEFVAGHSVGEYVAACVAGVFSLEDGLRLIAERARLMQALPHGGGMIAVRAREELVLRKIGGRRDHTAADRVGTNSRRKA
jgi:long-chain acyl-CoA synthetase